MNTEQLKTAEYILKEKFKEFYLLDPDDTLYLELETVFIRAMQDFAYQESKRAVDEALIDKDFIIYCLNQTWNYANDHLQRKDLGDIERDMYEKQKSKAKALMTKLDS